MKLSDILVLQLIQRDWISFLIIIFNELASLVLLFLEVDVDVLHVLEDAYDVDVVRGEGGEKILDGVELKHLVV